MTRNPLSHLTPHDWPRRCHKCKSDLQNDPYAGPNADSRDVVCPHCDGGGPVAICCAWCGKASAAPLWDGDEAFCCQDHRDRMLAKFGPVR